MIQKIRNSVLLLGVIISSYSSLAQEDVASREDMLVEQQNINFQTFFFEALQQKAIGNFDKAIYALEACNNIDKDNVAVQFELSKNYTLLFKYIEAEYYVLRGLEKAPLNLYMLRHLKEIKTRQNDYLGAVAIQNRIIEQKPEEEADLVLLYIKSGEIEKAISLLKKLDSEQKLPEGLMPLKSSLLQENIDMIITDKNAVTKTAPKTKTEILKEGFSLKKDFNSLKLVLEREWKTKQYLDLLKDSEEGLALFPAQAYLYVMNAKALNRLRKYQQALNRLEEGLDYLVDDNLLKADFMEEMSLSYKGLGDNKKATFYYQKAIELRPN